MSLGALPPVDRALLPAAIRDAPATRREAYTAATGFERLLVQQLTTSLAASAKDAFGGDSPYASLLPDALADGVMDGGGLGLATQLTDAIAPATEASHPADASSLGRVDGSELSPARPAAAPAPSTLGGLAS